MATVHIPPHMYTASARYITDLAGEFGGKKILMDSGDDRADLAYYFPDTLGLDMHNFLAVLDANFGRRQSAA